MGRKWARNVPVGLQETAGPIQPTRCLGNLTREVEEEIGKSKVKRSLTLRQIPAVMWLLKRQIPQMMFATLFDIEIEGSNKECEKKGFQQIR